MTYHQQRRQCPRHEAYKVAWLCAIPEEFNAAYAMLDEEYLPPYRKPRDDNSYIVGRIGPHNIVFTMLSGIPGSDEAQHTAMQLSNSFPYANIRLMVGIGGGIPSTNNDIRLGDVIVSVPKGVLGGVVRYDGGKFEDEGLILAGHFNEPPRLLLSALGHLRALHDRESYQKTLEEILETAQAHLPLKYHRPDPSKDRLHCPDHTISGSSNELCRNCGTEEGIHVREPRQHTRPCQHYGIIATSASVVKSARQRNLIAARWGLQHGSEILCIEMEAAGLMKNYPCLVIRGISDYCDAHKGDFGEAWKGYAALSAAAYAKELISVIQPEEEVLINFTHSFEAGNVTATDAAAREGRRTLDCSSDSVSTVLQRERPFMASTESNAHVVELPDTSVPETKKSTSSLQRSLASQFHSTSPRLEGDSVCLGCHRCNKAIAWGNTAFWCSLHNELLCINCARKDVSAKSCWGYQTTPKNKPRPVKTICSVGNKQPWSPRTFVGLTCDGCEEYSMCWECLKAPPTDRWFSHSFPTGQQGTTNGRNGRRQNNVCSNSRDNTRITLTLWGDYNRVSQAVAIGRSESH